MVDLHDTLDNLPSQRKRKSSSSKGRSVKSADSALVATEVILPAVERREDWSIADPACMDRLITAVVRVRDFDTAVTQSGCPPEMAATFRRDPSWKPRFLELLHEEMLLKHGAAAAEDAIQGGGAYSWKVFLDSAPKTTLDEAQQAELRAFKRGGMKGRIKALDDLIREAWRQREILSGGEYLPADDITAIVAEVTAAERQAATDAA